MNQWLIGGMLGLMALGGTVPLASSRPEAGGTAKESATLNGKEPPWLTDYAAAKVAARQSGKPLLVVFR